MLVPTRDAPAARMPHRLIIAFILMLGLAFTVMPTPAQAAKPDTRGLFGSQVPAYDGVYRQSAAILGLVAVRARVPETAIAWLLRQQCADGSFAAFRADTTRPCPAPDPATYTGPDSNSTAMAVMALRALASEREKGRGPLTRAAAKAAGWIIAQQNDDGSWEWIRGLDPDSTSTAMSLAAVGRQGSPGFVLGTTWLAQQMTPESGCGLPFQPGGTLDPLSTSWALIGAQGSLPYARLGGPRSLTPCDAAQPEVLATGSWLASALIAGNGRVASSFEPGATDWNATALATLGLSQAHGSTQATRLGVSALKADVDEYVGPASRGIPGALGTLLMVAHATGSSPRDFGGANLPKRLLATLQK